MAHRVLLSRLTMFLLHLWATIETTSAAIGTRPQAIDAHHSKPSLRNFFKKSYDRSGFEVVRRAGGNESSVESDYHSSGPGDSGTRGDVLISAVTTPSSSSGVGEEGARDPGLQQWFSERENTDENQTSSRSVSYCTNSVKDIIYNASNISIEMRKYDNFSTVTDVYSNNSLLVENGMLNESFLGDEGNEASWCSYPQAVPSAWSSFFKEQELVCLVNPHWLQFDPPSHVSHLVLASVYVVVMVAGLAGNGFVVYLFISSRTLRSPSNLLILNLAVSDFLLLSALFLYVYNSLYEAPAAGKIGCDVYGCVSSLTGTTSIMTLAAISLDRYLVITFPLDPFKRFSHRQVLGIIVITWMYASVFSVLPLVGIMGISYTPEGFLTSCSFDYLSEAMRTRLYIFSFFVAAWVVPLGIISFSYFSIVSIVSKQERHYSACQGSQAHSFKHQRIRRKKSSEVKLAKVVSGIIGLWVVAWTPYAIVALLGIFKQKALITPVVSMIPALFCKTAACLDPYVYALSHPRFKGELNKRLGRCRPNFTGTRNAVPQAFSSSTFNDIREERELSEAQGWNTTDLSCSSHPVLRTRGRASLSSPGSRSLISPAGEVYPRKSLSTYSFRRASRSLNDKREDLKTSRRVAAASHTELQTTMLMEFPNGRFPKLPFAHNCSFENGVEELGARAPESPAAVWQGTSQVKKGGVVSPPQDQIASATHNNAEENRPSEEISPTHHKEDGKIDYKSYFAKRVLAAGPAASSAGRGEGRRNSLPSMNKDKNGDSKKTGGKISQECPPAAFPWENTSQCP